MGGGKNAHDGSRLGCCASMVGTNGRNGKMQKHTSFPSASILDPYNEEQPILCTRRLDQELKIKLNPNEAQNQLTSRRVLCQQSVNANKEPKNMRKILNTPPFGVKFIAEQHKISMNPKPTAYQSTLMKQYRKTDNKIY